MSINQLKSGHSLSVKYREKDRSGPEKRASKRRVLTNCRAQERQVRIGGESQQATATYGLSNAEGASQTAKKGQEASVTHKLSGTQGTQITVVKESQRVSERHSLSEKRRGRDKSG